MESTPSLPGPYFIKNSVVLRGLTVDIIPDHSNSGRRRGQKANPLDGCPPFKQRGLWRQPHQQQVNNR